MKNNLIEYNERTFEDIKHIDEYGNEYWLARELMLALNYKKWEKFNNVINNAKVACEKSNNIVDDHFPQVGKMVSIGSGAKRKGLRYREDILDNMGSEELADNLFRIVQTEQKLKRDNIDNENAANKTHYEVGKKIRETIKELGGTMPEDLETPTKSLKELENSKNKKLII